METEISNEEELERQLVLEVPEILNFSPRFFGFPPLEFFGLVYMCLASAHKYLLIGVFFGVCLYIVGRRRAHKPFDWLTYIPYSKLKVPYPYLLPPGQKTFLP